MDFQNLVDSYDMALLQSGVSSEDLAATQVMVGSVARHAQIVIGGYGIDHIDVGPCALDKFQ